MPQAAPRGHRSQSLAPRDWRRIGRRIAHPESVHHHACVATPLATAAHAGVDVLCGGSRTAMTAMRAALCLLVVAGLAAQGATAPSPPTLSPTEPIPVESPTEAPPSPSDPPTLAPFPVFGGEPIPVESPTEAPPSPSDSPTPPPTDLPTVEDLPPGGGPNPTNSPIEVPPRRRRRSRPSPSPTLSPAVSPTNSPSETPPSTDASQKPPTQAQGKSTSSKSDFGMFAEVPQLSNCPPVNIVADLCPGGCPRCDDFPGTDCYCDTECALAGDCCCEECGTSETAETELLIGLCPSLESQAQKSAAPTTAPTESPQSSQSVESESPSTAPLESPTATPLESPTATPDGTAASPPPPTTAPTSAPTSAPTAAPTPKPTLLKTSKPTPSNRFDSFDFDLASSDLALALALAKGLPGTMPMPPAPAPAPE